MTAVEVELKHTPVIVGGGSGIGAAVVAAYRAAGVTPVVWDIAGERDVECDIRDPDAIDPALAQTLERAGVPTELTITSGVGHGVPLLDESVDDWDRVIAVNTRGPWLVMRAVGAKSGEARRTYVDTVVSPTSLSMERRNRGR